MLTNCNFAKVFKLNEEIANKKKIFPYPKQPDKRLADVQKLISLRGVTRKRFRTREFSWN